MTHRKAGPGADWSPSHKEVRVQLQLSLASVPAKYTFPRDEVALTEKQKPSVVASAFPPTQPGSES